MESTVKGRGEFSRLFTEVLARERLDPREAKDVIGISRAWVYELMRGTETPTMDVLLKIMRAFPKDAGRFFAATPFTEIFGLVKGDDATAFLSPFLEPEEVDYLEAAAKEHDTTPGMVLREAVALYRAETSDDNEAPCGPGRHARRSSFRHGLDHVIASKAMAMPVHA